MFEDRKARIVKAIALEKPDRTPVVLEMAAFGARATGMPVSEFSTSYLKSAEAMIETCEKVGNADGIDYAWMGVQNLSVAWLSKVKYPGKELPVNSLWQVVEEELMTREDYDKIVEEGWPNWMMSFVTEKIDPELFAKLGVNGQSIPKIYDMWREKGIYPLGGNYVVTIPFEMLCGARSFSKFIRDLYKMPDQVEATFNAMMPFMTSMMIQNSKQAGYDCMWVGGWRSASAMLAQPLWDRFVYPYFERIINEVVEAGITPLLHFDSNWERDLGRFKGFPKGKAILSLDGMTDIFKAKEILGDTMCIMGDVPASLLTLGTPDDVYNYSRKLIQEIGPEGFILHPGCDIPIDAKLENVQAMVAAATGK